MTSRRRVAQPIDPGDRSAKALVAAVNRYHAAVRASIGKLPGDPKKWAARVPWKRLAATATKDVVGALGMAEAAARKKGKASIKGMVRKDAEDTSLGDTLSFTIDNPAAAAWARKHAGTLILKLEEGVRQAVGEYVALALEEGTPPEALARQLRSVIGLRPAQAAQVAKFAAALAEEGRAQSEIDKLVDARSGRLKADRALLIARTETTNAQAQGLLNSWAEAKAEGLIPATAVKVWIAASESSRLSDVCRELDGQMVPLGKPFRSKLLGKDIDGPAAHPFCRSSVGLKVLSQAEFDRLAG